MAHAERGTKRRCQSCGAPYYDLNRTPPTCPKCHAEFAPVVARGAPARTLRAHIMPVEVAEIAETEDREAFQEDEVLETMDEDEHDDPVLGEHDDEGDGLRE